MRQLITRIDDELHQKLKHKASEEGRSMNSVVSEAIEHAVQSHETATAAFERRAAAAGIRFVDVKPPTGPVPTWEELDSETRGLGPVFSDMLEADRAAE